MSPKPSIEPNKNQRHTPPSLRSVEIETPILDLVDAASKPQTKGSSRAKGTRIPDDFEVTPDMAAWAKENGYGHLDLKAITEVFFDYWIAKPGQGGVKLDWPATWRNWIRRDQEFRAGNGTGNPTRSGQPHRTSEDFLWGQATQRRSAR